MRKAPRKPALFRHSTNTDWGHGMIVEETPAKVSLYFENAGERVFVNDPKYRNLLVAVEAPASEALRLLSKMKQSVGRLATKSRPSQRRTRNAVAAKTR